MGKLAEIYARLGLTSREIFTNSNLRLTNSSQTEQCCRYMPTDGWRFELMRLNDGDTDALIVMIRKSPTFKGAALELNSADGRCASHSGFADIHGSPTPQT